MFAVYLHCTCFCVVIQMCMWLLCCVFVLWLQRLEELVNELEPQLYPPEYIAEEVNAVALHFALG